MLTEQTVKWMANLLRRRWDADFERWWNEGGHNNYLLMRASAHTYRQFVERHRNVLRYKEV
jgi:hypothetical protein